jgi:hypothetical protein
MIGSIALENNSWSLIDCAWLTVERGRKSPSHQAYQDARIPAIQEFRLGSNRVIHLFFSFLSVYLFPGLSLAGIISSPLSYSVAIFDWKPYLIKT